MQTSISMGPRARQLYLTLDLIWAWTGRIIRARYQQSVMGWLWAIIQPAASAAILTIVFTLLISVETAGIPYILFSYVTLVPWTFFASSLTDMADALVQNMSLVTKIYFPREALPIASMLARLFDFALGVGVLVILIIYFQVPSIPVLWIYLPAILLVQVVFVLGLGLMASALNIFFRDVQPLLKLAVQLWFYASPIIYPVSAVPADLQSIYYLNPMVAVLDAYRAVLLYGTPPSPHLLLSAIIAVALLFGGYWFFKRVEFRFADIV